MVNVHDSDTFPPGKLFTKGVNSLMQAFSISVGQSLDL